MMSPLRFAACCVLFGVAMVPDLLDAAQFTVSPTRILLSRRTASALLTVRNEGAAPVRLQVKTHAWSQALDGHVELETTDEVIVFPTLVTIGPGEERKLRVAVTAAPGAVEKTFRVFLEELPAKSAEAAPGAAVQMLTRISIPVFLQPPVPASHARLDRLRFEAGTVKFQINNVGNTHFVPDTIRVHGLSPSSETILDQSTEGWYILAGGVRQYELQFNSADCSRVRMILVDTRVGDTALSDRLETPAGICAP